MRDGLRQGSLSVNNINVTGTPTGNIASTPAWGTGQTRYVNINKSPSVTGKGTSWEDAFLTITEGIAALEDYDVLLIAPGNYDEDETITLTGKYGCKILGLGTGMQWNEGSTTWRDVTSSDDLLYLTGCRAIEIAGIAFINSTAKDAITLTGLCYSTHIHDCSFVGDTGGGATGDIAIELGTSNGPDMYVHNCRFLHWDEIAINVKGNQRFVCHDCLFIVPDDGIGIVLNGPTSGYQSVWDCNFMGTAGDGGDQGIDIDASSGDGKILVTNSFFAGCTMTGGGTGAEVGCVRNYKNDANGGTLIDPT